MHESGRYLFPGTGFPEDTGGPGAEGGAVNVALPPGTTDAAWLRAFHAVVPPLLEEFRPEVLVTQHGCDSHVLDPLAHLALTVDAQRTSYAALHELAHEHAGGRWVATGGGGYELGAGRAAGLDPPARRGGRRAGAAGHGASRRAGGSTSRSGTASPRRPRMTDGADAVVAGLVRGLRPG